MTLRSIFFVSVLSFASQVQAEEGKGEAAEVQVSTVTYCQQLGMTAGFEASDLEDFVKECEEKRSGNNKPGGEE